MESAMADLSLQGEDEGLTLEGLIDHTQVAKVELSLAGRFLTTKKINFNLMRSRMADIWQPQKGILVKEVGESLYVFQFYHQRHLKMVLEGGPWTYENQLLLLHQMKPGECPTKVPLFYSNFWVQVYEVPAGFKSEVVGKILGNFFGRFWNMMSKEIRVHGEHT